MLRLHALSTISRLAAITASVVLSTGTVLCQAGVPWHESIESAQAAAALSQRPVLVVFTAEWCEACETLDQNLWRSDEATALVTACFEPVLVDVDRQPDLARRMGISHLPTACVLGSDLAAMIRFDVPQTPVEFISAAGRAVHDAAARLGSAQVTASIAAAPPSGFSATAPASSDAPATDPSLSATPPDRAPETWAAETAPTPGTFRGEAVGQSTPNQTVASADARGTPSLPGGQPHDAQRTLIEPTASASGTAASQPPWLRGVADPSSSTSAPTSASRESRPPNDGYPTTPVPGATTLPPPTLAAQPSAATEASATDGEDEKTSKDGTPATSGFFAALQKPLNYFRPKPREERAADTSTGATVPSSPFPVGLDGFCPVTLAERATWTEGRAQWGAQHRGRTYLFAGETEQQKFLSDPDRYAPALSGDDPVLAFEGGEQVAGQRRYGVTYQSRIYLFSSLETRSRFAANPQAYASKVRMAEKPAQPTGTVVQ